MSSIDPCTNLDARAGLRGKPGGMAGDHADQRAAVEDVVEDLVDDQAGGSGDEQRETSTGCW
jgi:hypothetical protein